MLASGSKTYSNPVTVAALIRVNGLDAVLRRGLVRVDLLRNVRQGVMSECFDETRRMLAERRRGRPEWRMLKFARRHGHECITAAAQRPHDARLVAALTDAWMEQCSVGVLGCRHGWDVAGQVARLDRSHVFAQAAAMGVDLELVQQMALARMSAQAASSVQVHLRAAARVMWRTRLLFGVTNAEMIGRSRTRRIAVARHFYCYWVRRVSTRRCRLTGRVIAQMSYPMIGRRLGGRDHTTALHSEKEWTGCRDEARQLIAAARKRERA